MYRCRNLLLDERRRGALVELIQNKLETCGYVGASAPLGHGKVCRSFVSPVGADFCRADRAMDNQPEKHLCSLAQEV